MTKEAQELVRLAKALAGLTVPEKHQKNIAIRTLKMNDVMARVMGGMTKEEARAFLKSIGYSDSQIRRLEASRTAKEDSPDDIAADVISRMRELDMDMRDAFFDIGYIDLYHKTRRSDLPSNFESMPFDRQEKVLSRAVGRAMKRASVRTARSSLIDFVLDQRKLGHLQNQMDEQTYDLMISVYQELSKALELTPGQQEAINRLQASQQGRYVPDMHRNNIFKAAHALGMRLPSAIF